MGKAAEVVPTGIAGLDEIMEGGLTNGRMYLIHGGPGTGKSTLALQYLVEGLRREEHCLLVGITGAAEELELVAEAHGWKLDKSLLTVHEIDFTPEDALDSFQIFHASEMVLGETMKGIMTVIDRVQPKRVVIDSLSEFRLLAEDALRFRREIIGFKKLFLQSDRTMLLLDYPPQNQDDIQLEAVSHGTIILERVAQNFGPARRRLQINKFRAKKFHSGWHDFDIRTGGIEVFPALLPYSGSRRKESAGMMSSGKHALDTMLSGGLDVGSSTSFIGPSGVGKTTLATQFLVAAAERGERVALFSFDESTLSLLERSKGLGLGLEPHLDSGRMKLRQIDIAEMSPGEFIAVLRADVEERGTTLIVIDSLNGYLSAMPDEKYLILQLHELLAYLGEKGVTTIMTVAQHGFIGSTIQQPIDISYLADNVLLLRFFEFKGEIRRALSVVKKRRGKHEMTIRELTFSEDGIHVSERLDAMHGVLSGMPELRRDHREGGI